MLECPACEAVNPADARFCRSCGRALTRSCSVCGRQVEPDSRFCPGCGTPYPQAGPDEERKLVTVLFADVVGFTALGESLDPEALRSVMGRYFEQMRSQVEARGGRVEKFIGDAVAAVFGVPTAHEDDVERALSCGQAMQGELELLNATFVKERGLRLAMRVGIATGEVLAAPSARPEEGIVTGDAMSLAARLQEVAEPGQVLVSERTARAARAFHLEPAGERQLKGRRGPERVWQVPERADPVTGGAAGAEATVARTAPLVGREDLLAALEERYRQAVELRSPHLVTVYGEPGVGKSRIATELAARLGEADGPPRVLRGRCRPEGEQGVYGALAEVLKLAAGVLDNDPTDVALERLRELVDADLGALDADARHAHTAALAHAIGLKDPQRPMADLPPRQVRYEVDRAWRAWFDALVAASPVLLLIDDLHWADPSLLDLLESLLERVAGPLLVLCLARPELATSSPGWGRGPGRPIDVTLDPLEPVQAGALVEGLAPGARIPAELGARIVERAEGNPFFLEEIVRGLVDRAVFDGHAGTAGPPPIERIPIPDTVQAVLASRIDLLGADDRRLLRSASVAGTAFWPGLLGRLVGVDPARLEEPLARLLERSLVVAHPSSSVEGQREFGFKHALTQEVAYESLPRTERVRAHARAAAWLDETLGERRREAAEPLAYHYEAAYRAGQGDPGFPADGIDQLRRRAVMTLLAGSSDALGTLALESAERLADRALALAANDRERADALEALGETALAGFQGDRAWRRLTEAADARASGDPEDHAGIARLCAEALAIPTRWGSMKVLPTPAEATRYLELGLRNAGDGDSVERVKLLTASSVWPAAFGYGSVAEAGAEAARRQGEAAVDMALRLERADLASAALDCVGLYWYSRGRYREMGPINARRLELVPQLEDPREIEDVFAMAAHACFHEGRYREALELGAEGVRRTVEISPLIALHSLEWRALARFELGDWDGFLDDLEQGAAVQPERDDESRPGFGRRPWTVAALIYRMRGDAASADRALARMRPMPVPPEGAGVFAEPLVEAPWSALLLSRTGHDHEALQGTRPSAVPYHREAIAPLLAARCEVVARAGRWDLAASTVADARAEAARGGSVALPAHADRLAGRAAFAAGDHDTAVDTLRLAAAGFDAVGARWERACTDLDLCAALDATDRREEASDRLGAAREVMTALRSTEEIARADARAGLRA